MGDPRDKRPRAPKVFRPSGKQPAAPQVPEFKDLRPTWSVAIIDRGGPYGWRQGNGLHEGRLGEILGKLRNFVSMTWGDILYRSGKQNHAVRIGDLCREALDRLVERHLDDIDALVLPPTRRT